MKPVVIVPGLLGSALADKDDKQVWGVADPSADVSPLGMRYNAATETVISNTEIHAIAGKKGVSQLLPPPIPPAYFHDLIQSLEPGAVDAAPYDWRLVPQQETMEKWIVEFKEIVRKLREANGQKKVFIVAHSNGNLMSMYLFHHERQANSTWVQDNIEGFISVSPPYGGAAMTPLGIVKFLPIVLSAGGRDYPIILPAEIGRNSPCYFWLLPQEDTFGNATVLEYDGKSYDAHSFKKEFLPNFYPDCANILEKIVAPKISLMHEKPPIDSYLVISEMKPVDGKGAILGISYNSSTGAFTTINETERPFGDGAVPYKSMVANKWFKEEISFPEVSHIEIVSNPAFIAKIKEIIAE